MAGTASALQILQSRSLPDAVREEIHRLILEGTFEPGDKLGEAELACRLGVSRGPVREAFRALEEAGLVRLTKNRGVFVREVTREEADELYVVRAGLDEMAGRLLAPRIGAAQVRELRAIVDDMSAAPRDMRHYFPLDAQFHDRLAMMAGNRKLLELHRRIAGEMQLFRRQSIQRGGDLEAFNREHCAIVEALASGDGEKAGRIMHGHIMRSYRRLTSLLGRSGSDAAKSTR
ncbi:MAG: FCD domain-containing protein [Hyphomicrobiales bacterium]|nr:FCD domain-containing protein [Hyphomicrobiales bacterium]